MWCVPWTISRLRLEKRFLGYCSLVCRDWALQCRALTFGSLRINAPEDAASLIQLVRTPRYSIGPYLQVLGLSEPYGESRRPWMLQALAVLRSRLPCLQVITYSGREDYYGGTTSVERTDNLRQEPPKLSRRLSLLLRGFTSLRQLILMQLHLHSFVEIARVARALEGLEVFVANSVSWDVEGAQLPWRTSRRGPLKLRADRSTAAATFLGVLGSAWYGTWDSRDALRPHVAHDSVQALRQLVACMAPETMDIKTIYQEGSSPIPQSEFADACFVANTRLMDRMQNLTSPFTTQPWSFGRYRSKLRLSNPSRRMLSPK